MNSYDPAISATIFMVAGVAVVIIAAIIVKMALRTESGPDDNRLVDSILRIIAMLLAAVLGSQGIMIMARATTYL